MPEMVFKEDVVKCFKQIKSYRRIDLMCSLLNMCLPFELRYLGTCLEDLGKRDFHDLRDTENRANNPAELSELQCLSDKRTQRKLALYLALLRTCNYPCSNGLFKILSNFDVGEINTIINNNPSDENPLEELLLVYTLALNHPSFTFQQKTVFGNILVRLQEEEAKLATKHLPVDMNVYYAPMQVPCQPPEEPLVVPDMGVGGPCTTMTLPPSNTTGHDLGKGRSPLPPGFGVGLSPDSSTNYMQLLGPPMGHWPVMPPSTQEDVFSRQSSPSPSRASTPPRLRTKDSALVDPLRETLGKEMPGFLPNLQTYSIDELRRMTDEELKELGLSAGAIHQLRSIVTKIHNTNGLCNLEKPPLGSKLVELDKVRMSLELVREQDPPPSSKFFRSELYTRRGEINVHWLTSPETSTLTVTLAFITYGRVIIISRV
uniref:Uncharacterized protein n=1 Tax=Timema monikensis TaxID=170555 RepID=A0A7R9EK33_9NEOP|nr:unnamed protein product [Timema monikensis]